MRRSIRRSSINKVHDLDTSSIRKLNESAILESPVRRAPNFALLNDNKLSELKKHEKEGMINFLRAAKQRGTVTAFAEHFETVKETEKHNDSLLKLYTESEDDDAFGLEDEDELDIYQDEDGQDARDDQKKYKCLINPDGIFKNLWDNTNLLLIIYVATVTPFKFSFIKEDAYPVWEYGEYLIDLFFAVDIIVTFFTPLFINDELVKKHKLIAKDYLKFWFWLDVFSVIPLQVVISSLNPGIGFIDSMTREPRIYKLLKIVKLSRTLRLRKKR